MNVKSLPHLLASLLLTACGPVVADGGGSSGDGGAGGQGGGSQILPAIALTRGQMDVAWDEYWASHGSGVTTGTSGGDLDPNDLFLRLSDMGVSCGAPIVELPCAGHYDMTLVLPPSIQDVGVYDLEDPVLFMSSMSETGPLNSSDPEDCSWMGGSTGAGTLEIVSIDQTEVHFKVTLASGLWETNPEGDYVAPRCQDNL